MTSREEPADLRLHLHNTFYHVKDQALEAQKLSRSHSGPALSRSSQSENEAPESPMVPIGPGHWTSESSHQDSDSAAASCSGKSSQSVRVSTEKSPMASSDAVQGRRAPLDHRVFGSYTSHSDSSEAGEPSVADIVRSRPQKATTTAGESSTTAGKNSTTENAGSPSTTPQSEGVPGCTTCAWVQRVGATGPCRKCVPKGPLTWSKALIARRKAEDKRRHVDKMSAEIDRPRAVSSAGYAVGDGRHGNAPAGPSPSSTSSSASAVQGPVTRTASLNIEGRDNADLSPQPGSSARVSL